MEEVEELDEKSWLLTIIKEYANVKKDFDNEIVDTNKSESRKEEDGKKASEDANETVDMCRVKAWRCLSGVMEGAVKYVDRNHGLWR